MAIGKITGSVVADNTLTESNLAFGISGQSAATSWATDTLKVNIIESDDSTAIQINDSLNISGTLSVNTIESDDSSVVTIQDNLKVTGLSTDNAFLINAGNGTIGETTTLTVDTASNYLGINQTSPEVTLHMTGEGAQSTQIRMEQYNDTADAPDIRTRRYRGSVASPSAVQSGDYLFRSNHEYYNGTGLVIGGAFGFDNINNAARTQFAVAVDTSGSGTSLGTQSNHQLRIDGNDSGAITFNNAYKFPTADGSADQILQTDGSGALTFVDVPMGTLPLGDSSSNAGSVPGGDALEFRSGNSVTATVSGNGVTYALNDAIVVNEISSGDSTNIRVADNLVPAADNTYSLGTPDRKWSALYVTGSTIFLDTTKLQVDGSGDFTVKDAGNNLKRVVASEIEIGTGSNKIKMQRGANGRVKFLDENDTPTPVLQIVGDDSTGVLLNTNETVKIAGTQNITTAVSGDTLTITGPDLSSYITASSTATLTNKTFDANGTGNSISNIEVGDFASGEILDEDNMSSNSATALATQQSIKAYVDSQAGGNASFTFVGDDSTGATVENGDSIQFKGGEGVQITVDDDSSKGFAVVNVTSTAAINLDGGNATTDYNLERILLDGGGA